MFLIPLPFELRTFFISKIHSSHEGFQLPCLFSSQLQSIINTLKLLSRSLLLSSCFEFSDMIEILLIIAEATSPHELRKFFESTTGAGLIMYFIECSSYSSFASLTIQNNAGFIDSDDLLSVLQSSVLISHAEVIASLHHSFD